MIISLAYPLPRPVLSAELPLGQNGSQSQHEHRVGYHLLRLFQVTLLCFLLLLLQHYGILAPEKDFVCVCVSVCVCVESARVSSHW